MSISQTSNVFYEKFISENHRLFTFCFKNLYLFVLFKWLINKTSYKSESYFYVDRSKGF